jgi:TolA-binding protein
VTLEEVVHQGYAWCADEISRLRTDAAAKDARIAELEATELARQLASCRRMLDQITDKSVLAALRDANARAEQAEKRVGELEAHIREQNDKWADDVLRVEQAEKRVGELEGERDQLKWAILNAGDVSFVGVPELSARIASLESALSAMEGHDKPCYYCGERCSRLSAFSSKWPVALCHEDEPGVVKWHHDGCVSERLARIASLETALSAMEGEIASHEDESIEKDRLSADMLERRNARIASLEKSVTVLREVLAFAEGSVAASAYRELHEPPFKHGRAQEALEKVRAALQQTEPSEDIPRQRETE